MKVDDIPNVDSLRRRLYSNTERRGDCLIWTGFANKKGYGMISLGRKANPMLTHRAAYLLAHGEVKDDLEVCHTCDTPACIELVHLFEGTTLDNYLDSAAKGRRVIPYGELGGLAKLSDETAYQVIVDVLERGFTRVAKAAELGMSHTAINQIVKGRSYPSARARYDRERA